MVGKRMAHGRMTRELLRIKGQLSEMRKIGFPTPELTAAAPAMSNPNTRMKERLIELRLANQELLKEIDRMKRAEEELKRHLKVTEHLMARRIEQLQQDCQTKEQDYRELATAYEELDKTYGELESAYNQLKAQRNTTLKEHILKEDEPLPQIASSLEPLDNNPMTRNAGIKACWMGPGSRIMEINLAGMITAWSPAAESLCGYTADEVKDFSISLLIPHKDYDQFCQDIDRARSGSVILNTVFLKKNGEQVNVSLKLSPSTDKEGNTKGVSIDAVALL